MKLTHTDQCDDEALCLVKAAKIAKRDFMESPNSFDGMFSLNCQENMSQNQSWVQ